MTVTSRTLPAEGTVLLAMEAATSLDHLPPPSHQALWASRGGAASLLGLEAGVRLFCFCRKAILARQPLGRLSRFP